LDEFAAQRYRERLVLERLAAMRAKPEAKPALLDFVAQTTPHLSAPVWLSPISDLLERMPHEPMRVCFSTPPQHGKSTLIFHYLAWLLRYYERQRILYLTYSIDFATSQMREAQPIARSAGVPFDRSSRSLCDWRTTNGGTLYATGVGGSITGRPGGMIVIDDLIKDWRSAQSAKERESADQWLQSVVLTRMHPTSSIAVIATRWHEDDQIGRLVRRGWTEIKLPAIKPDGTTLWSERPVSFFDQLRENDNMSAHMFSALYQCDPRPREGRVFNDISYYDEGSVHFVKYAIGVDLAFSARTSADYSAAVVLGKDNNNRCYVVDVVRRQCKAPDFAGELLALQARYPGAPLRWYAAGTEKGAADYLIRDGVRLSVMSPHGDKLIRATPVSAAWEQGRVLVPHNARWLAPFVNEALDFTGSGNDANDDQIDALAAAFDALATSDMSLVPKGKPTPRERPWGSNLSRRERPY